jgi:hypothetical protein
MGTLHIEMEENGFGIFDSDQNGYVFEGIEELSIAYELHEMLLGEREDEQVLLAEITG